MINSQNKNENVALIGTGTMGIPIAQRLLKAGYPLSVFNRTAAKALPLQKLGARVMPDAKKALLDADCVIFLLPDAAAIQSILAELSEPERLYGKTVVQMGLLTRQEALAVEKNVKQNGGEYLNASLCGSKLEAAHGTLFIPLGGSKTQFDKYRPLFEALGTPRYVGGSTASATAALATMQLSFSLISAFCLAVGMLEKAQIPVRGFLDILKNIDLYENAEIFSRRIYLKRVPEESAPSSAPAFFSRQRAQDEIQAIIRVSGAMGLNNAIFRAVGQHLMERTAQPEFDSFAAEFSVYRRISRNGDGGVFHAESEIRDSTAGLILTQLTYATMAAHDLAVQMFEKEEVPTSCLVDIVRNIALFKNPRSILEIAYQARLGIRQYTKPFVQINVIWKELKQLIESNGSIEIESPIPGSMMQLVEQTVAEGLDKADFFSVYEVINPPAYSETKRLAISNNREHINPSRVSFLQTVGMPFVLGKREGCYLQDVDAQTPLIDLHCNGGVFNLGHRHPEILKALRLALDRLDVGNHHLLSAERGRLAERLAELLPGDISRVAFGVAGGESVDLAIKLARAYTRRHKIIFANGGFHGHTGLAVFAGDKRFYRGFSEQPQSYREVAFGSVESLLGELDSDTAAVIFETVPSAIGMPIPARDFYLKVRAACDSSGAQLIIDEVQTGWGRTGKLWGIEHFDVVPDMMILAKGMGAGIYPMSAVCFRPHLGEFFADDSFVHLSTMGGSEVGCAVVLAQLDITTNPGFMAHVRDLEKLFCSELDSLIQKYPDVIAEFRHLGLFMGIKYVHQDYGPLLTKCAYEQGLLLLFAGLEPSVSQLLPPLIIEEWQVKDAINKLDAAINRARQIFRFTEGA